MITRSAIVLEARRWIGTPYRHQASLRGQGADCLGLVRGVWREFYGCEPCRIPAYTQDWGEQGAEEQLLEAAAIWLRPKLTDGASEGDVIIFRMKEGRLAKHLAISAFRDGTPTFIHAYTGHGVVETHLSLPWQRKIAARFEFPLGES